MNPDESAENLHIIDGMMFPAGAIERAAGARESDRLLSPVEAAEYLGVHPETLRRLFRAGRIPGYKVGRYLRFDVQEVKEATRVQVIAEPVTRPDFGAI